MFLLFQSCRSYGSPAEFSVPSVMDLLTVTLLFYYYYYWGFFLFPPGKLFHNMLHIIFYKYLFIKNSLVRELSEETTFFSFCLV